MIRRSPLPLSEGASFGGCIQTSGTLTGSRPEAGSRTRAAWPCCSGRARRARRAPATAATRPGGRCPRAPPRSTTARRGGARPGRSPTPRRSAPRRPPAAAGRRRCCWRGRRRRRRRRCRRWRGWRGWRRGVRCAGAVATRSFVRNVYFHQSCPVSIKFRSTHQRNERTNE